MIAIQATTAVATRAHGTCDAPAAVRALLIPKPTQWLMRKEEAEAPAAMGIGLFFGLVGGPIIDRFVAERASEFASRLAEAAAEPLGGKAVHPELERTNEALVDETYASLNDTYGLDILDRALKQLGLTTVVDIDLAKPKASRA